MRFALTNWGTRGEIEPFVAVGGELVRRGREVRIAVAPELVDFVNAAGPQAVAYGPEFRAILGPHRDFWAEPFVGPWNVKRLHTLMCEYSEPLYECRGKVNATLMWITEGADLLLSGMNFEDVAINICRRVLANVPFATLHHFPLRANGQVLPFLPAPVGRATMTAFEWLAWRGPKSFEDTQRRELGLPPATRPWPRRATEGRFAGDSGL